MKRFKKKSIQLSGFFFLSLYLAKGAFVNVVVAVVVVVVVGIQISSDAFGKLKLIGQFVDI